MKINRKLSAYCRLTGSRDYPALKGTVLFYQVDNKVWVTIQMSGFRVDRTRCNQPIASLHIHEGNRCTGTRTNPFRDALEHYNPDDCNHPFHAGDLGNLFINKDGTVMMSILTDRFTIDEIMNKTMIVHKGIDDFKTQPSGNSGDRIACGVIRRYTKETTE